MPAGAGLVVSQKAVQKLGKKFGTHPIGTGPYEFASWSPKQKIVLKRFDKYAGANKGFVHGPFFEEINIIPIVNDSAAETALRAGDVDFGEIATGSVDRFKSDSRFNSVSRNTLDYQFMAINVTDPQLKDSTCGSAIRYGIDVPSIIEAAFDGKWTRANAIIPKNMGLGYWKGAPAYGRDVDKAKGYLAKTGLSNVTLTLACDDDEASKIVCQVIQANLKDVGITINVRTPSTRRRSTRSPAPAEAARTASSSTAATSPSRIPPGRPSGSRVRRTASGTGTTGATRAASTGLHYAAIKETNPASARSSTRSCRSSGTPTPAWSGSRIRRATTPVARA